MESMARPDWAAFPAQIASLIFQLHDDFDELVLWSQVCQNWRVVIHSLYSFYGQIVVDDPSPAGLDMFEFRLSVGAGKPIALDFQLTDYVLEYDAAVAISKALSNNMSRTKALVVQISMEDARDMLDTLRRVAAPLLTSFKLCVVDNSDEAVEEWDEDDEDRPTPPTLPADLFHGHAPLLTELDIENVRLPDVAVPALQQVHDVLYFDPNEVAVKIPIGCLDKCPQLHSLTISAVSTIDFDYGAGDPRPLPHLRNLTLNFGKREYSHLLTALNPNGQLDDVLAWNCSSTEAQQLLGQLSGPLSASWQITSTDANYGYRDADEWSFAETTPRDAARMPRSRRLGYYEATAAVVRDALLTPSVVRSVVSLELSSDILQKGLARVPTLPACETVKFVLHEGQTDLGALTAKLRSAPSNKLNVPVMSTFELESVEAEHVSAGSLFEFIDALVTPLVEGAHMRLTLTGIRVDGKDARLTNHFIIL